MLTLEPHTDETVAEAHSLGWVVGACGAALASLSLIAIYLDYHRGQRDEGRLALFGLGRTWFPLALGLAICAVALTQLLR
jgi:hypothetical protein